jgi:hypothetical protein
MNKPNMKIIIIAALMIALFTLAACSSAEIENAPTATKDQQSDVYVPIIEKDVSESDEYASEEVSDAYPELEPETENQEVEALPQNTAVADSQSDEVPMVEGGDSQEERYPVTQEEPTQVIKPTPRGNKLVATNPSTVKLDSGKLQLVELFAFW